MPNIHLIVDANGNAVNFATSQGAKLSAFGDELVAQATNQVYVAFPYGIETDLVKTSGAGNLTQASGMAIVGTTNGTDDKFVLETQGSLRYIPSQGGDCKVTPFFASGSSTMKQVVGCGDDFDGFFFGMSGVTLGIYHRQFGAETFIPQTDWNVNKLDGTSGTAIDPYKGNVCQIQFQWLGVGQIGFFMEDPDTGGLTNVHNIQYVTRNDVPSVENPSFHVRYEIDNNGTAQGASGKIACLMGRTEGGPGLFKSFAASGELSISTDAVTLGTLRNNTLYFGKNNHRVVELSSFNIYVDGNTEVIVEGYKNMPLDGSEVYVDIEPTRSVAQRDATATFAADPGGSGMVGGGLAKRNDLTISDLSENNIELAPGDTFSIVLRRTRAQSYTATAFLSWKEFY